MAKLCLEKHILKSEITTIGAGGSQIWQRIASQPSCVTTTCAQQASRSFAELLYPIGRHYTWFIRMAQLHTIPNASNFYVTMSTSKHLASIYKNYATVDSQMVQATFNHSLRWF
jgi:hypothetical protein